MLPSRGRLILQSLLPVPHPARGRPPVRPSASRRSPAASPGRGPMELQAVVASLEAFASLAFAESWDNVGLLVEPSPPHSVRTLFLTNDLTEEVMDEALAAKADLILSYHPPVFRPLKRLTWKSWKERLVIRALENRVGIYSPHTASDAAPQGVNHWLAKGLGACTSLPIHPATGPEPPTAGTHRVELRVSSSRDLDKVLDALRGIQGTAVATFSVRAEGEEKTQVSVNCSRQALLQVVAFLSQNQHLYEKTEILSLEKSLRCRRWPCAPARAAASCEGWPRTSTSQARCPTTRSWTPSPGASRWSSASTATPSAASSRSCGTCWSPTWRTRSASSCPKRTETPSGWPRPGRGGAPGHGHPGNGTWTSDLGPHGGGLLHPRPWPPRGRI
ncbi:NIF3-like protein 1 isoform X2 [Ornithorhynchus anatinus]|uniref:NIF3-like protein 1 isoform X2 n=1 Tax=Ornithorhynchus anatinus TaxID=9258 RepID=UPI0010A8E092|nr:NIF3-like protein 1 isoform X2 [Ornithorhynchus anatinus]